MSWNYRMVKRLDGTLAVHEVYYNKAGRECSMTAEPVSLYGDSPEEIVGDLIRIKADVRLRPLFVEPDKDGWAKPDWEAEVKP